MVKILLSVKGWISQFLHGYLHLVSTLCLELGNLLPAKMGISGSELAGKKSYSSTLGRRACRKENLQCVVRKSLS